MRKDDGLNEPLQRSGTVDGSPEFPRAHSSHVADRAAVGLRRRGLQPLGDVPDREAWSFAEVGGRSSFARARRVADLERRSELGLRSRLAKPLTCGWE